MSSAPDHARAPDVARAALKEATDLFGRLLAAAIRKGTERAVTPLASESPNVGRPARLLARVGSEKPGRHVNGRAINDDGGAWHDTQREAQRAQQRDARYVQADPLAPQPRPRPSIGQFTLMDLGPDTCRFPFGDGPFLFCGATPVPGRPYCAGCMRGLYRSPDPDEVVAPES